MILKEVDKKLIIIKNINEKHDYQKIKKLEQKIKELKEELKKIEAEPID